MKYNNILVLSILLLLSACAANTDVVYNKNYTRSVSITEPIHLSFQDNKLAPFYFILKHKSPSDECKLLVRWSSPDAELIFNGQNTVIKFLVNNQNIISRQPIKQPRIVSYSIEKGHEEEAVFTITIEELKQLANAKKVDVELNGRYITVIGHFNKLQTFRALKKFLYK